MYVGWGPREADVRMELAVLEIYDREVKKAGSRNRSRWGGLSHPDAGRTHVQRGQNEDRAGEAPGFSEVLRTSQPAQHGAPEQRFS